MIRSIAALLSILLSADAAVAGRTAVLLSRWQPGDSHRIVADFEVGGDLKLQEKDRIEKVPMSVVARFRYDERLLPAAAETPRRALRYYEQAEATIKIGDGGAKPVLPDDRRRVLVELDGGRVRIVCPDGLLEREVLDLMTIPGDSLVLDKLLPGKELSVGQSWKHNAETIQALVGLDSIAVCNVNSDLVGVEQDFAKVRLSGTAEGASDGIATKIELKASYLFNMQNGRITQMHLAIREKHKPGPIGPGVVVVAKVRLSIEPAPSPTALSDQAVAAIPATMTTLLPLSYVHAPSGLRLAHDRAWHVTSEQRERVVMRYVTGSDLTAQCNLVMLPNSPKGKPTSLEQFQKKVRFSLGDRFGRFVSSQQWQNAAGMLCRCIAAEGKVEGVPVLWRCYLVSAEDGQRVAATCTVEQSLLERLGTADRILIESLALMPPDAPAESDTAAARPETRR